MAAAVVAVDQVTKTVALDHLRVPRHVVGPLWLELTFNSGAAFGLGRGATPVVEAVVVALIGALVIFARRATRRAGPWVLAGSGLLIGGAFGNLADRLFRSHGGAVIDFIDAAQVGGRQLWPVFNVADASIVVGAIVLAVGYALGSGRTSHAVDGHGVDGHRVDGHGVDEQRVDEQGVDGRA
ncbi:MAG: signal peptidase II [Acidimicrobiaceae bacterium]|nr:signal peptidase II [Acidimicrobiaceae bacterium]